MAEQTNIPGAEPTKPTYYRWVVLVIVCLFHVVNFADRANIGVAIPALRTEFGITNTQLGFMASIFFAGYCLIQIPAGWFISKFGNRGFVSLSMVGFSAMTALIGTASSAMQVIWYRFGLGIFEAPTPVGSNSTVKAFFPPKERGTALGILTGATTAAVTLTPIVAAWIMVNYGWRYIFYYFAIPGFILSVFWYIYIRRTPQETPYCNAAECNYIETALPTGTKKSAEIGALGWFDGFLRAKKVDIIDTNAKVFTSRNIIGVALTYFFIQIVFYGILTWVPSYLVQAKGYSIIRMGWVAATPWAGGIVGNLLGGWVSDKYLFGRRKPMMMISGIGTVLGMWAIINAPNDPVILGITMFLTGVLLNCSWPSYFAFPMGLTTVKTYPLAISVMIFGGNIGAFVSPWTGGWILDTFKNYDFVFVFMGAAAVLSFLTAVLVLDEPVNI